MNGPVTLIEFEGKAPSVHPDAFVAPTATLVGDVTVEAGASIWYGAVLRADICTIVVRAGANVQDGTVVHAGPGVTLEIGPDATIGHGCVVHGERVGAQALVGNGSVLLDGSTVGSRTLVAAGSVLTPGTHLPDGVLAAGTPCQERKPLAGTGAEMWVDHNAEYYRDLASRHAATAVVVSP